jgi:hypothetical protein
VAGDQVVLQENDSMQLGAFTTFFARGNSGEIFVGDMTRRALLHFDQTGAPKASIGRGGAGPGEFELPGSVVVLPGDSVVGAYDINKQLLTLFRADDGKYLREVRLNSRDAGSHWGWSHDTAYIPLHMGQHLVGIWSLHDSSATSVAALPPEMSADPGLVIRHGRPGLAISDSGLLLLLPSRPGVLVVDRDGSTIGTVSVPAARRKGEPTNLGALERRANPAEPPKKIAGSSTAGMARLSNGDLILAHLDMEISADGGSSVRFTDFKLYLSVLRADLSAACVDALVPVSGDVPLVPVFNGDTVFVLTREVGAGDQVTSTLRSFTLDLSGCTWIPTGGIARGPHMESRS